MRGIRLADAWDVIAFLVLLPVVVLMAAQLPGDWENHRGASLPGMATVTIAEPFRSGIYVQVDVSNEASQVVARGQEVNGESPEVIRATFPVRYLPPDGQGATQVYVAGHDPFMVNLLVLVPSLLVWLASLLFVGARVVRLGSRLSRKVRPARTWPYRAGQGYTRE